MDKMIRILGALTIAVTLLTGFSACSNEDMLDKTVEPQNIQVTVGAGFDDATTRSAIVDDNGNRKLTFTEGDRLFITATITGTSVATTSLCGTAVELWATMAPRSTSSRMTLPTTT